MLRLDYPPRWHHWCCLLLPPHFSLLCGDRTTAMHIPSSPALIYPGLLATNHLPPIDYLPLRHIYHGYPLGAILFSACTVQPSDRESLVILTNDGCSPSCGVASCCIWKAAVLLFHFVWVWIKGIMTRFEITTIVQNFEGKGGLERSSVHGRC